MAKRYNIEIVYLDRATHIYTREIFTIRDYNGTRRPACFTTEKAAFEVCAIIDKLMTEKNYFESMPLEIE